MNIYSLNESNNVRVSFNDVNNTNRNNIIKLLLESI